MIERGTLMQRDTLILANMICSIAMIMIDQTVVGVVLPPLQQAFGFSPSELQWVVNSYTLALAAMLICGGWLGDRIGRFKTFSLGALIFSISSLTCALSASGDVFIAARAGQGIGAALMQPSATAILFTTFDLDRRARAMAVYVGAGLLFMALGPLIGGLLTNWTSWHWVFLINVPIGLFAAATAMTLRGNDDAGQIRPFDIGGAVLFIVGTVLLVFAIQGGEWGNRTATLLGLTGVVAFVLLYVRRNRAGGSIVDFSLLADREFFGCCALLFCIQFAMLGQVIYSAVFFQNVLGFSPVQAGFAMLPVVLTIAVTAQVAGRIYQRVPYRWLAAGGAAAIAAGFLEQAVVLEFGNMLWMLPGMFASGLGMGLLASTVMLHALGRVAAGQRSSASGMVQTIRQIGGVFGVACIGAIVNFSENAGIAKLAPHLSGDPDKRQELQLLLYQAEAQSRAAISKLQTISPNALEDLRMISTTAISEAYLFGGAVVLVGSLLSVWAFRRQPV